MLELEAKERDKINICCVTAIEDFGVMVCADTNIRVAPLFRNGRYSDPALLRTTHDSSSKNKRIKRIKFIIGGFRPKYRSMPPNGTHREVSKSLRNTVLLKIIFFLS